MLTESQKDVLSLIGQGVSSSKTGLIHKGTAKSLIKRRLIKMSANWIDYELTEKGKEWNRFNKK